MRAPTLPAKPLTDTSTPEKWAAHQAVIAGQRDDNLPMKRWTILRVVRQEFVFLAETRDRALAAISAGNAGPFKEDIESQTMQSEEIPTKP